jgi:activator of 2-hydroxyglutaryl-CoA dehydratase
MISAGIDSGIKNVKAVVMKNGKVVGKAMLPKGLDMRSVSNQAYDNALKAAGLKRSDVQKILVTGAGKKRL